MASIKISQLTAAASVTETQEFEINDSGTSKKVTGSQIKTFVKDAFAASDITGLTATAAELNILDGVTATTAEINTLDNINTAGNFGLVPSGAILLWSGSVGTIPSGWFLCDGANSTPDLRDRFVVGAGSTYAVGATGGQNSITSVPAHTHDAGNFVTSNTGAHSHNGSTSTDGAHAHNGKNTGTFLIGNASPNASFRDRPTNTNTQGNQGAGTNFLSVEGSHAHNFSTSNTGSHSHTISGTTSSTGNASVDTRPPYYALCYIMKG